MVKLKKILFLFTFHPIPAEIWISPHAWFSCAWSHALVFPHVFLLSLCLFSFFSFALLLFPSNNLLIKNRVILGKWTSKNRFQCFVGFNLNNYHITCPQGLLASTQFPSLFPRSPFPDSFPSVCFLSVKHPPRHHLSILAHFLHHVSTMTLSLTNWFNCSAPQGSSIPIDLCL